MGSTDVEAGGSVTITQAEAKTSLVLTFSKKYESMFFTINSKDKTPTFDVEGKVATFSDIELTENGSKKIELEVRAADCAVWKASITVIHKKS